METGKRNNITLRIIGGGLAGCEAAWQAAKRGIDVILYEMRPIKMTGAHLTDKLGELVCSNSLGSNLVDRASGLLKEELRLYDSLLVACAEKAAVPAGNALAVDRLIFSNIVEKEISLEKRITVKREEIKDISCLDTPLIISSGPLTSTDLAKSLASLTGQDNLFFYDAVAPIVSFDSINMNVAYRASRYNRGENEEGDYINCPFTKEQYLHFYNELLSADRISLREFDSPIKEGVTAGKSQFFEGCLPVEIIAERGVKALTFGPLRPVGLIDPRTNRRPWGVLQLRRENIIGDLYNMVGFQTNLKYSEQDRVFHMIPGLENAEFIRHGQMHRNTYLSAPSLLSHDLQLKEHPGIYIAGQLSGVEGYMGNIASGLVAGINAANSILGEKPEEFPQVTMIGSLIRYIISADSTHFQPMKANFGILPPLEKPKKGKKERANQYAERSLASIIKKYEGK